MHLSLYECVCVCVNECHIQKPENNFLFHLYKGSRDGTQGSGLHSRDLYH